MTTVGSLEHLEAEFADSLICGACERGGKTEAATHVVIYRKVCQWGGPLEDKFSAPEHLACDEHAEAVAHLTIGQTVGRRSCSGCGQEVTRQSWMHVVARIEPIRL